ncbi:MAG TPA: hypothetical protein VGM50_11850 [Gemmatimonadaceae bacterium]
MTALRALLAGIVDYAGLFPPAALDMSSAVRNYAQYRSESEAWMLGRFVLPASRLDEFSAARAALVDERDSSWRLAVLLGPDAVSDLERAHRFNEANGGASAAAVIDVVEGKFTTPESIAAVGERARPEFTLFAEIPIEGDSSTLMDAIAAAGVNAKIRTGGVTADAFPSPELIVRFIRRCVDAKVTFKATAGLHHPLRAEQRLTYATDAPRGVMYGFLNVFLVSAYIEFGMSDADAHELLLDGDPEAFAFTDASIAWRGRNLSAAQLRLARDVVATSFGSCSFREPVDDLHELSILH